MVALAVIPASACRDGWHCPLIFLSFHSALRRGQTNSNTALFLVVYHVFSMFAMACKGGVLFLVSILLNEQQMRLEWRGSPPRMLLCICASSVFFLFSVFAVSLSLCFVSSFLSLSFLFEGREVCNKQAKNASASKLVTCISRRPNGVCVDMMIIDWSSLTHPYDYERSVSDAPIFFSVGCFFLAMECERYFL